MEVDLNRNNQPFKHLRASLLRLYLKDKNPYFITELISIPIIIWNPLKTKTKKEPRAFYGKIWEQDAFQHTQNKLMNENTHKSLLIREISTNQAKTCQRKANIHTRVRNRDTNININCLKYPKYNMTTQKVYKYLTNSR